MPFFEVVKGQDAYIEYSGVVEASDPAEALQRASAWTTRNIVTWTPNGNVPEFDDAEFFEDRTKEITAENFEAAVKQIHDAYDYVDLRLKPVERDMILAALRLWNDVVNDGAAYINDGLLEIATDGGKNALMNDNTINNLCERINV